ncbi:uncharacterized protein [Dermacentor albipictus]|uniref:uncharacterized protein isoform X1 n=1 Tax=Dermacentor albipictus TaxID=60249 RepID=UPI0038FC09D8
MRRDEQAPTANSGGCSANTDGSDGTASHHRHQQSSASATGRSKRPSSNRAGQQHGPPGNSGGPVQQRLGGGSDEKTHSGEQPACREKSLSVVEQALLDPDVLTPEQVERLVRVLCKKAIHEADCAEPAAKFCATVIMVRHARRATLPVNDGGRHLWPTEGERRHVPRFPDGQLPGSLQAARPVAARVCWHWQNDRAAAQVRRAQPPLHGFREFPGRAPGSHHRERKRGRHQALRTCFLPGGDAVRVLQEHGRRDDRGQRCRVGVPSLRAEERRQERRASRSPPRGGAGQVPAGQIPRGEMPARGARGAPRTSRAPSFGVENGGTPRTLLHDRCRWCSAH